LVKSRSLEVELTMNTPFEADLRTMKLLAELTLMEALLAADIAEPQQIESLIERSQVRLAAHLYLYLHDLYKCRLLVAAEPVTHNHPAVSLKMKDFTEAAPGGSRSFD
jgi:hypothetical protein